MKKFWLILVSTFSLLILAVGCSNNDPASAKQSLEKTSTVVMTASAEKNQTGAVEDIPVPGGSLHLQSALLNIEKFCIDENNGFEGEHECEHQDENEGDDEVEVEDIIVTGPFGIEISNGEALLDSVAVYPGTFKKVDFTFAVNPDPPFNGNTILLTGNFIPTSGVAIPFSLRSQFAQDIQSQIADGGIIIANNVTVQVVVIFDLAAWFNDVDFGNATIGNGEILIDNTHNADLLLTFETNLAQLVEIEEDQ